MTRELIPATLDRIRYAARTAAAMAVGERRITTRRLTTRR